MFWFKMKPSSGSQNHYLAKIRHSVRCEYMEVLQTLSVLWLHSMTCEACALCAVFMLTQRRTHTLHCSYYAAITVCNFS